MRRLIIISSSEPSAHKTVVTVGVTVSLLRIVIRDKQVFITVNKCLYVDDSKSHSDSANKTYSQQKYRESVRDVTRPTLR